ncbi:hypothetical protein V7S43_013589 [Phytophthora oleae]|uniref:Gag protein n=1 Tax=Phytophthora oleae TaxID=2107226 RepID=A0ABD3F4F1_9STRA
MEEIFQASGLERPLAQADTQESGERRAPVGAGRPTGVKVSPHAGRAGGTRSGDLAPEKLGTLKAEKGSGGLLVVRADVQGYNNPFRVLIDSGASKTFARRQTVAKNHSKFANALRESEGNGLVVVRLADGTVVKVPKVQVGLAVKFDVFDSVESFSALEMDKYDLILGIPWLRSTNPGSIGAAKPLGLAGLRSLTEPWNRQDAAASEEFFGAGVVESTSPHTRNDRGPWMAGATGGVPCPMCGSATIAEPHARSRSAVQAATVVVPKSTNQVGNLGPQADERVPEGVTNTRDAEVVASPGVGNTVPREVAQTITDAEDTKGASKADQFKFEITM